MQKSHVEQWVSCCTSRSTSIEYQPFIHQKHSIPVYTCKKAMLNNEFHVAHLNPPSEAFKSSIHRQKSHVEQCVSCCTSKSTIRDIQFHYTHARKPCWTMGFMLHIKIIQTQIIKKSLAVLTFKHHIIIFLGWNLDKLNISLRLGWKILMLIKTSPPFARVAALSDIQQ